MEISRHTPTVLGTSGALGVGWDTPRSIKIGHAHVGIILRPPGRCFIRQYMSTAVLATDSTEDSAAGYQDVPAAADPSTSNKDDYMYALVPFTTELTDRCHRSIDQMFDKLQNMPTSLARTAIPQASKQRAQSLRDVTASR